MDSTHSFQAWAGNLFSVGAVVSAFMGWVPGVAAVVALVWYLIQIYESATVQRWLSNHRTRKLAKLKAKVIMLEAQGKPPLPGPGEGGAALH